MADCADDDDDCEVIFENSPLYRSMVDAGLGDIAKEDVCKIETASSVNNGFNKTSAYGKSVWCRLREWCFSGLLSLTSFKHTNKAQMEATHREVFGTLAESSLLTEDDHQFLQDLRATETQQAQTGPALPPSSWTKSAVLYCITLCLVVWSLWPWQLLPLVVRPWEGVIRNTLTALLLPVALSQAARHWHRTSAHRKAQILLESVERVLVSSGKWSDVSVKCVRFIQESELVARGFTFVGKAGTGRVVRELQPVMSSQQARQCPLLRKTLFMAGRSAFHAWRQSFAHLTHTCPVKVEISGVTRYCSEIPLSQYPPMLHLGEHGDAGDTDVVMASTLHEMSDGFSVDVLKSLQELNGIHMSEFLRRLAVCFFESTEEADILTTVPSLLERVSGQLDLLTTDLQSCLTAHRHGSVRSASSRSSQRPMIWQQGLGAEAGSFPAHQLRATYTAVHSLELHLLAALKKIQDLSDSVERKLDAEKEKETHKAVTADAGSRNTSQEETSQDHTGIEPAESDRWAQMLLSVRSELSACSGCVEEGLKQLDLKIVSDGSKAGTEETKPVTVPSGSSQSVHVVSVSAQDTPVILDEVFEAYSEPQDYDSWQTRGDLTASEEEVWQKRQKSNLKLCLGELQSIIDVRAAQHRERERLALHRMRETTSTLHGFRQETDPSTQTAAAGREAGGDDSQLPCEPPLPAEQSQEETPPSTGQPAESAQDLARDMEERVEFWKQFDMTFNQAAVCSETDKPVSAAALVGCDTETPAHSAETRKRGDDIAETVKLKEQKRVCSPTEWTLVNDVKSVAGTTSSVIHEAKHRVSDCNSECKTSEGDSNIVLVPDTRNLNQDVKHMKEVDSEDNRHPENKSNKQASQDEHYDSTELLTPSSSQGSGFVFVSKQLEDSKDSDIPPPNYQPGFSKSQLSSISRQLQNAAQDLGQFSNSSSSETSPLEEVDYSQCYENDDDADSKLGFRDNKTEETKQGMESGRAPNPHLSEPEEEKMREAAETMTNTTDAPESMTNARDAAESTVTRVRDAPEGTEEHLSLPSAPSPFAFSIATMVASRARGFARTEDTFGDSSSEEEGGEEHGDDDDG